MKESQRDEEGTCDGTLSANMGKAVCKTQTAAAKLKGELSACSTGLLGASASSPKPVPYSSKCPSLL